MKKQIEEIKKKLVKLNYIQQPDVLSLWRDCEARGVNLDIVIKLCDKFIKQNTCG